MWPPRRGREAFLGQWVGSENDGIFYQNCWCSSDLVAVIDPTIGKSRRHGQLGSSTSVLAN
jgi:hypothetical protein